MSEKNAAELFNAVFQQVTEETEAKAFCLPMSPGGVFQIAFDYINWKGESGRRIVIPIAIEFRGTEWHPEPQWLLRAFDVEERQERLFAMRDISEPRHCSLGMLRLPA